MRTSTRKYPNQFSIILLTLTYLLNILEALMRKICYISYTLHALQQPILFVLINILLHSLLRVPFWPNHFPAIWLRLLQFSLLIGLIRCVLLFLEH